jgi:hypothetical protein
MRQKTRQHLEEQLQRIEQQRDDTKRKLRALARQAQQEQRYRCGEYVELAGLAHLNPGTLLGGLCELATMLTDREQASRWKAVGDARLEEHRCRKAHRSSVSSVDGDVSDASNKATQA